MSEPLHTCADGSEFSTDAHLHYRKVTLAAPSVDVVPHSHAFTHDMVVVAGTVLATIDTTEHTLRAGDVLTVPATALHAVRLCPCAARAVFLCIWPDLGAHDVVTQGIAP